MCIRDSYSMGCACADYDNDGATDLYVTNYGPDVLYNNGGDGTFTDVTLDVGIDNPHWASSAAFFDSDNDGWLDLHMNNDGCCPRFAINEGGTGQLSAFEIGKFGNPAVARSTALVLVGQNRGT